MTEETAQNRSPEAPIRRTFLRAARDATRRFFNKTRIGQFLNEEKVPLLFSAAVIGSGLISPWGPGALVAGAVLAIGNMVIANKRHPPKYSFPACMILAGTGLAVAEAILVNVSRLPPSLLNKPAGTVVPAETLGFFEKFGFGIDTAHYVVTGRDGDAVLFYEEKVRGKKTPFMGFRIAGSSYIADLESNETVRCGSGGGVDVTGRRLNEDGSLSYKRPASVRVPSVDQPDGAEAVIGSIGGRPVLALTSEQTEEERRQCKENIQALRANALGLRRAPAP